MGNRRQKTFFNNEDYISYIGWVSSQELPVLTALPRGQGQANKPLYMYLMKCNLVWELSIASKRNLTSISDRIPKALYPTNFFLIFVFVGIYLAYNLSII